ncbi:hypothetical protein C7C46_09010 [Streptomyces tateyamensis]|uniref:Uncharacterized protein n=1 Tax=Streptomyces tateyamensis TaxID=565073 RepID=A0A2V4PDX6_9ACTN|nr:hypothetical protein [Streptomyces tateyamensis]PYC83461.1 hypothetical protein C7C46_09010 [Streptomyces tateyamensis]
MTRRLDQLPATPADLAATVARLQRDIAELRARAPDLSAADALMPPLPTNTSAWPATSAAAWTTVASCSNLAWHPGLRLVLATIATGGAAGNVRVLIGGVQWGPTVAAGTTFDNTGLLPGVALGAQYQLSVQAQLTSGSGSVAAQPQLIRSIP